VNFMQGQPRLRGAAHHVSGWPVACGGVQFSRELRDDVLSGDITLSVRLWKRPQVKQAAATGSA
jgi:hypothetical protein